MRAKLEYVVDDLEVRIPLETMELEALDHYTYTKFKTTEDIINSDKYRDKIGGFPKDCRVIVTFNGCDIPVCDLDKFGNLGGNPMMGDQSIRVMVRSDNVWPTIRGIRKKMASYINSPEAAEEFYRTFEDEYTPLEKLDHLIGMMAENTEMVSNGIKRIMGAYTSGYEGYLIGRCFVERLENFKCHQKDNGNEKIAVKNA